jgi:hypothetical protein
LLSANAADSNSFHVAAKKLIVHEGWVQTEVGHNLRWNSDKIMRRAGINEKRICHLPMVNSHLSFGASAAICAMAESSRFLNHCSFNWVPQNDN